MNDVQRFDEVKHEQGDGVFRIPPIQFVGECFKNLTAEERRDWGQVENGVPEQLLRTRGGGVKVCVCDTGASQHRDMPDLLFAKNFTGSATAYDRNGHSTHVGGTIAARGEFQGIASNCQIGFCKVLGDDGSGSSRGIAAGIDYAVEQGCNIINLSLGGGYDADTHSAIKRAIAEKCWVFAAAGNSGYNGRNSIGYPGKLKETICVASYSSNGDISNFSSGGEQVDIACPGAAILSCWPGDQYRAISGTSMATPHAVGLAALALSIAFDEDKRIDTVDDLRNMFREICTDKGAAGFDVRWGWGVPRAKAIIDALADEEKEADPAWWL